MPGLTIMILTNVGLQIFNSWRNTNTNDEMRRKQQAFQEAAQERNHEKMMQLLREGQAIQEQTEEDMHNLRMQNIENDFDNLIKRIFQQQALHQWPLRVLPMVMKNQSLGSIKRSNENIALHVILTPSNSDNFNNVIFPKIELELENFLNQYWNTNSTHPIIFYSGAWKSNTAPTQNDIEQLHTDLSHLPVLVLTPKFQPNGENLVFTINMWGVETSNNNINEITIQPTEQELTYYKIYAPDTKYGDKLTEITIKEFVPYLQSMIGYLADVYFWTTHHAIPILPSLLTQNAINNQKKNYIISSSEDKYSQLMSELYVSKLETSAEIESLLSIFLGNIPFWDEQTKRNEVEKLFILLASKHLNVEFTTLNEIKNYAIDTINKDNSILFFPFLQTVYNRSNEIRNAFLSHPKIYSILHKFTEIVKEEYEIFDIPNFEIKHIGSFVDRRIEGAINPQCFNFIVWNENIIIGTFCDVDNKPCVYVKNHSSRYFIFRKQNGSHKKKWKGEINKYNLLTKKITQMEGKNFEEQFGQKFERIGRGVGRILDSMASANTKSEKSVWDKPHNNVDGTEINKLLSYFIANAGKTISAERVENMSLQLVLDWVDKNVTPFAEKVYILKGFSEEHNKFIFCVFFGSNTKIHITDGTPTICFVTSGFNEEMKQTFKENNICIIPLK